MSVVRHPPYDELNTICRKWLYCRHMIFSLSYDDPTLYGAYTGIIPV